jgi:hypothetical protein
MTAPSIPPLPEPVAWLRTQGTGSPVITEDFLRTFSAWRGDFEDGLHTADQMLTFYKQGYEAGREAAAKLADKESADTWNCVETRDCCTDLAAAIRKA